MVHRRLIALIEATRRADFDLSIDELRDIVYLAGQLTPTVVSAEAPLETAASDVAPDGDGVGSQPSPERVEVGTAATGVPADRASAQASMLPYHSAAAGNRARVPIRAPALAVVRGSFAKAFRPLKRKVRSPVEVELDVRETASRAADTDLWDPVLVPSQDRWLGLAVAIDDAASGPAWSQEISALLRASVESGAFGGIRVWRFDSDTPSGVSLTVRGVAAGARAGRDSREIIDPSGRRAVLVLSDCVGSAWGDGRVGVMIEDWAVVSPVAIVHLLPQRLWGRCRPRLVPVDWRARRPFTVGQPVEWRSRPGAGAGPDHGTIVPVLDLTAGALGQWARLVAGGTAEWMPGMAFNTAGRAEAEPAGVLGEEENRTHSDPYRLRVARFRAVASPEAFRLATLLSAAPLQLPIIRMVQRTMLGTERSTYWAEILLSGLVHRLPAGAGDQTTYDFAPGIREQLFTGMTRHEGLDMLHEVSEFVSARMGGTLDFLALLTLDAPGGLTDADRPFARVALQLLRALGGVYADKADQVLRRLTTSSSDDARDQGISTKQAPVAPGGGIQPADGDLVTSIGATETSQPPGGRTREPSRALIWDVPQRTPHFTGRDGLLKRLRQELVEHPNLAAVLVPRALFGLGGVGKTALANEYAYRYSGEYDVVWWIPAEDPADVRRSLVDLSRALRLPENTDQAETIKALLKALHEGHPRARWLLVYDNATSPDDLREYLPHAKEHGHVLITSRDRSWEDEGALLTVDVFDRPESTTLLRRRAAQLSLEDADELAELLEDLPLALHQAAAWHSETNLSPRDYRRRYAEKLALLSNFPDLPAEYPQPVGAAFGVSYDQLQSRSLAAAQLLQLCSHFGPEPIAVDLLWRGRNVKGLPSPLNRRVLDLSTLNRELREIGRYELIKFDQVRNRFQLHRLVQGVLRSTLPEEERQTTPRHAHSILALANPGNPEEIGPAELYRHGELSPHIGPSGIVQSEDIDSRRVVLDQIRYRHLVGDYEGSRDLAVPTAAAWEARWGERDELVLLAKRHLATTLRSLGNLAEALRLDEHVLALFQETVGPDSDHTLVTANGYGADLRALGRFAEARAFDQENLAHHRAILRADDPATLRTANNYAVDLRLMGEFEAARALDDEAVQHWMNNYGYENPDTLFAISNLVRDLYGLGRYGEALTLQQEAITAQEAALGAAHPNVLLARRTVAMLLRKLGRYQQARERAEVNHLAFVARFAPNHEYRLAAAMSLANALRDEKAAGGLERASQLLEEALHEYVKSFAGHPFVDVCKTNLAIVLRRLGDRARARQLNEEAVQSLRAKLGERHSYTLCGTTNLANDRAIDNDYAGAAALSGHVLELSREVRGHHHPYTLGCALNHALDLAADGRRREADQLWSETTDRFAAVLGPDHPDTLAARNRERTDADIEPPPT